ncbi:MAG: glycosyltransferase family 2 protein [Caldisericaceae bacterium]|nr:glycosyltransferase family 2 protein [Caldisericaceae bacterium]
MNKGKTVSAIISVYNEERTIENVITSLLNCYLIDELIVVNDGSTDKSGQIISKLQESYSFKHIDFPQNRGKSFAMATGVESAQGEVIVFVDADIIGLKCSHIQKMLYPLLNGEADMVIGQPYAGSKKKRDDPLKPLELLAGERAVYRQDVLPIIDKMKHARYGAETLMNLYYKSQKKRIKIEYLWGLIHLKKFQKKPFHHSFKDYPIEAIHIFRTIAANYLLLATVAKNFILKG